MKKLAAAVSCAAIFASCTTYTGQYYLGSPDYVLATHEKPDGSRDSYRLEVRSSVGDAHLRIVREYPRQRPFLGLQVTELDKGQAERRGVKPYSGLLVTAVYPKSSAQAGGVVAGDVLLSLDGQSVVYEPQLAELESQLQANKVATATVLRGQTNVDLKLTTSLIEEKVSDTQDIELESPTETHRPFAGVGLRGIPATWCERIWGSRREAVIVTSVEVGSPAWLAGVRGGDVIDEVDGAPVPPVAELSRRIAEQGIAGHSMHWRLSRGPDARHEATVQLSDYSGETNFWFPLVFFLQNGARQDRWSVGPFGLLLSNRNTYECDQTVRVAQTTNVFSALLGLFRVESSPEETEVRLLWFIKFDT